jgi:N-acetylglucosamine-6-sulfatase
MTRLLSASWHMGGESDAPQPGFNHSGSVFGARAHIFHPASTAQLSTVGAFRRRGYITDELTDYAIEWLKRPRGNRPSCFIYRTSRALGLRSGREA